MWHRPTERPIHLEELHCLLHSRLVVIYRGFPSKLHHEVPNWVESGEMFHIRIRIDLATKQRPLTEAVLGNCLLDSVRLYQHQQRWFILLFLLMPDHIHAVLSFGDEPMNLTIGAWKHFHSRMNKVRWQNGFFDHRLRNDERREQLSTKLDYIRQNPVVAGLCSKAENWPWIIHPTTSD